MGRRVEAPAIIRLLEELKPLVQRRGFVAVSGKSEWNGKSNITFGGIVAIVVAFIVWRMWATIAGGRRSYARLSARMTPEGHVRATHERVIGPRVKEERSV
jgi:hypothetical protein